MAYNLAGLDPKDPRFQQLMAQALRNGNINPVTMKSQVEETISGGMGRPSITMESQVEDITSTPLSSGMASAYVDQAEAAVAQRNAEAKARSLEGRERKIDSQRSYADSLRGRAAPQGMTAGPLDVYYGPNIGQSLEYAGNQLMGGYMAGKANEGDIELDVDRGLEKSRLEGIVQDRYKAEQARLLERDAADDDEFRITFGLKRDQFDELVKDKNRTFEQNVSEFGKELAEKIRSSQAAESISQANVDLSQKKEDRASMGTWDPMNVELPDGKLGSVVYNSLLGEYRFGNKDGRILTSSEATKLLGFEVNSDELPASMKKDRADRRAIMEGIYQSIGEIDSLSSEGKETSGVSGLMMSFIPDKFDGIAEDALFDPDEMKQRAKNTFLDAQIIEAATTGVVSEGDAKRLRGLRVGLGGLTPEQQKLRLYAASEIFGLYGMDISMEIPEKESGNGTLKNPSDMSTEELMLELGE